jgi:hypothetical protein
MFLRRQSASAVDSAVLNITSAATAPFPSAPVPTSSKKSTFHKIGLFLRLRTESPTSYPTTMPTTATPTTSTPTDTPSMTPINSPTEVPTEVPTAAPTVIPTDALTPPPLPLPTTAKPTTIAKDNENGSLLSLTPNETIIDPLNNTINSITSSGGVVVYPNINGKYSDWGGVSSVCDMMRNFTSAGRRVSMVAINQSDWLCGWGSTGNKMGMYLQARALALYHDIAFEFAPSCEMIDNLVTWLPQSFLLGGGNDASNITGTISAKSMRMSSDPCKCPGQPITQQCVDGWPHLAQLWHSEIREALTKWALSTGKAIISKGTATIHFRCGDIIDPAIIKRGESAWYGFNKPGFYAKYFNERNITAIDFLTTSLGVCNASRQERYQDCINARECSRIAEATIQELSATTGLSRDSIRVFDKESTMWTMHHIVFSELTFCSPGSTFCLFPSLGSNHVIHPKPNSRPFPAMNVLSDLLSGFELDTDEESVLWMNEIVLSENSTSSDVAEQTIAWIQK